MNEEIVLMEENDIEEINIEEENYSGKPYVLPIASADTLGGIKVGANLTIEADGTLNAQAGGSGGSMDILTATNEESNWLQEDGVYQSFKLKEYAKIGESFIIENGEIKIGKGVSKILVNFVALLSSVKTTGNKFVRLNYNHIEEHNVMLTKKYVGFTGADIINSATILYNVKEGDILTLQAYGTKADFYYLGQTFLTIQKVA